MESEQTIQAVHFSKYVLPESFPAIRAASANGPTYVSLNSFKEPAPTIYMRGEVGTPFVQSAVFGDKDTQAELREKFDAGANLKVVAYVNGLQSEYEEFYHFVDRLNRWGNALVKEKFAKNAKNSRFQQCSLMKSDDNSVKLVLDFAVLSDLKDANQWESFWSMPRGLYDIVFQITSFWVSPQGCGYTLKARRMALVESTVPKQSLAPTCFLFGDEYNTKDPEVTPVRQMLKHDYVWSAYRSGRPGVNTPSDQKGNY